MNEMRSLIVTEARLLFRDPVTWLAAIALPTVVLLIFGSIFGPSEPDPALGGLRFIDVFVPSLVVITVGTLGIQTLPIRLATYREKGVLRRLSTTPAQPDGSGLWQSVADSRRSHRTSRSSLIRTDICGLLILRFGVRVPGGPQKTGDDLLI